MTGAGMEVIFSEKQIEGRFRLITKYQIPSNTKKELGMHPSS